MRNKTLFFLVIGIFALISFASCISKKTNTEDKIKTETHKAFLNRDGIPYTPNCKDNRTDVCIQNTISDLILKKANERNLILKKDTLQIGIRINDDGTVALLNNVTSNPSLKDLTNEVVPNISNIEPGYLKSQKRYISTGYKWYIIIHDNKLINRM